jgi:tRNA A37 N6-isopentenylltransferase MiaA
MYKSVQLCTRTYTFRIMEEYMNVHAFRSNLKQHMDDALHGKEILIERGGVTFQLLAKGIPTQNQIVRDVKQAMKESKVTGTISTVKIEPLSIKDYPAAKVQERGLCRNGHLLNRMGRCDTKGCKYA